MSLPTRTFSLLHEKVLKLVQELEKANGSEKTPKDKSAYSKHWWFDFQNRNPDIKELWKSLPLQRSLSKYKSQEKRIKPLEPSQEIKKELELPIQTEGCKIEENCQYSQIIYKPKEPQSYPPIINTQYPIWPLNNNYNYNNYLLGNYLNYNSLPTGIEKNNLLQNFSQRFY